MLAGQQRQAVDGVLVGSGEARGLSDTVVVSQVFEDVDGFFGFDPRAVEGGSFPFGEFFPAGGAAEAADLLFFAGPAFLLDVSLPFLSIEDALGVLAAELFERSHGVILGQ